MKENIYTGEKKTSLNNKVEKIEKSKKVKMVKLTFKENRKYELNLNREVFLFKGRQTISIPEIALQHKNWTPETAKLFLVSRED